MYFSNLNKADAEKLTSRQNTNKLLFMKKLLNLALVSAIFAISLTSCKSSDEQINEPKDNIGQTYKSTAKGSEIHEEEQQAIIDDAIALVTRQLEDPENAPKESGRKAVTLCTTGGGSFGHACVYNSSGYLVNVSWQPQGFHPYMAWSVDDPLEFHGTIVSQCNC